jgi:hypothetical protein
MAKNTSNRAKYLKSLSKRLVRFGRGGLLRRKIEPGAGFNKTRNLSHSSSSNTMSLAMESFARSSFAQFMSVYREVMEEKGADLSSCADLERSMWAKITGEHMPKGNKLPWALVKKNIKVQLPYMPDIINYNSGCQGLKKADGLYIPCGGKCEAETVLCAPCTKIGAKYGSIEDRTAPGTYMDPEDKHEITYGTWLAKKEKTIEEVNAAIQEAGFDFTIPESYLAVNAKRVPEKHRPGRPKAKKEVSESDSESESESEPKVKKTKAKKAKSDEESEPKAKKAAKKAKSEDSDSESEPKAKKAAKKAKSEDSESESEPKVKKTKAKSEPKAKKATKKDESDDEDKAPKAKKAAKKDESDDEDKVPKAKKAAKKAKSDDEDKAPKAKKAAKKAKSEDSESESEPKAKKTQKKSKESDESGSESDAPKAKKSPKKVVESAPEPSELQLDAEGFEAEDQDEDIEIDEQKFKLRDGRMVFNMDGEWVACIEDGEVNWRE